MGGAKPQDTVTRHCHTRCKSAQPRLRTNTQPPLTEGENAGWSTIHFSVACVIIGVTTHSLLTEGIGTHLHRLPLLFCLSFCRSVGPSVRLSVGRSVDRSVGRLVGRSSCLSASLFTCVSLLIQLILFALLNITDVVHTKEADDEGTYSDDFDESSEDEYSDDFEEEPAMTDSQKRPVSSLTNNVKTGNLENNALDAEYADDFEEESDSEEVCYPSWSTSSYKPDEWRDFKVVVTPNTSSASFLVFY